MTPNSANDSNDTNIDSSASDNINVSTALNNSSDNNVSEYNNNSTSESNNNTSNPSEVNDSNEINCNTNSNCETNINDNTNPINNLGNNNEGLTEQSQILSENNEENTHEDSNSVTLISSENQESSAILCDNTESLSIGYIAQVNNSADPYSAIQDAIIPETIYVTADNSNNTYDLNNCINNLEHCTTSSAISADQLNYLIEQGLKFNHNCTIRFKNGDTFYQPFQYSTTSPAVKITLTNYQGDNQSTTHPVFSRVRILDNPDYRIWTNGVNFSSDDISTDDRNNISEDKLGKIWCIDLVNRTHPQYSWIINDNRFKGTSNNFVDYDNSLGRMVQTSNNIGFIYDKDNEKLYGNKVSSIDKLNNNFDFYSTESRLYVYCDDTDGPSKVIRNMYFALPSSLLTVKSNTIVDGIDFEYTGGHAISGDSNDPNLKDIEIKNCNINYIGGYRQINSGDRLGNGIEFFMYGSNIDIHDNIISNCYDTATTLQGPNGNWNNISIHNNKFSNNSQSFEVWSKLENGETNDDHHMSNITFANNLCIDQGRGWGYNTRPDKDRACDIEIQLMQLDNSNTYARNRHDYGDDSGFTQFCKALNDKVYIKSVKYPYTIYDIETVIDPTNNTTTVTNNPLKLLTSQDIKFDYDLTSQTASDTITLNKDHTIANTEYTWFINSTNSLKNATKIDSEQINNSDETTSITPNSESGEKHYFCVASYDSGDTRTASIVKAVKVDIPEDITQGGDTTQGSGTTQGGDTTQGSHHSSSGGSSSHSSSSSSSSNSVTESSYENTGNNNTSNSVTDKQEYIYKFDSDLNAFIKINVQANSNENISETTAKDLNTTETSSTSENKGKMKTGWINDNNSWYYLNSNGSMKIGWLSLGSQWYYLDTNGSMKTGWHKVNNSWYYFYSDGSMAANTSIDGYTLGTNGAMK